MPPTALFSWQTYFCTYPHSLSACFPRSNNNSRSIYKIQVIVSPVTCTSLPVLLVASLLSAGAIASTFLPPIYRAENRPPLQRVFVQLWRRITRTEDFAPGHYGGGPVVDKEITTSFIDDWVFLVWSVCGHLYVCFISSCLIKSKRTVFIAFTLGFKLLSSLL